jgi:hypothetical protein
MSRNLISWLSLALLGACSSAPDLGRIDLGNGGSPSSANEVLGTISEDLTAASAGLTALPRTGWVASASVGTSPDNALDGNSSTRWTTGTAQVPGQWFAVDMKAAQTFSQITLDAASSTGDYPRGYQVFVSNDGTNFGSAIATGSGTSQLVSITVPTQAARYVKVVQTGSAGNWWSIAEFNVYASTQSTPQPPTSLVVSQATTTSLSLTWQASPTSGATYVVFRGTTPNFTPSAGSIVATNVSGTSYTNAGLATNTIYYYCVAATLDGATSTPSNVASATDSLAETTRIETALHNATDGQIGLYLKSVGGPVLAEFNEFFTYDPASSIKIVAAVQLLRDIDAGQYTLGTTTTYYESGPENCPNQSGGTETESLATLLNWMLENSDNSATRSIIDLVGGFSVLNATAVRLGMTSTSFVGYPGCTINNTLTEHDAATLYEQITEGSALSATSRTALFVAMAPAAGDFTGTLLAADAIVDSEASAFGLTSQQISLFQAQLELHYKAGSDYWCTGSSCAYYYAMSGIAIVPTCSGSSPTASSYVWGLFVDAATNATNAQSAFLDNDAEPLREPIRSALSTWKACASGAAPVQINAGGPAVAPYHADEDFSGGTTIDHASQINLQGGLVEPAPSAVYQTARTGNFSYAISGFTPGSRHMVRLHFAETYFSTGGSRIFNVSINGSPALTNFDIFSIAQGNDIAIASQLAENARPTGDYLIEFTSLVNNSLVSGIEVW